MASTSTEETLAQQIDDCWKERDDEIARSAAREIVRHGPRDEAEAALETYRQALRELRSATYNALQAAYEANPASRPDLLGWISVDLLDALADTKRHAAYLRRLEKSA